MESRVNFDGENLTIYLSFSCFIFFFGQDCVKCFVSNLRFFPYYVKEMTNPSNDTQAKLNEKVGQWVKMEPIE
jgi:hypothetical protein